MKKFIVVLSVILLSMPAFAINSEGEEHSLNYLNQAVHSKIHSFMQSLYVDEFFIDKIKAEYKKNPNSIKLKEVNDFCRLCIQRNQNLLNSYREDYFTPAYNEYKKYDKSISFQNWIDSVALSERSEFYEFYRFTESNLEDCQKIYNLSK